MSLTPRKRVAKHVHGRKDIVESAEYEVERPVAKLIPSSEIVLNSTEDATVYLDNWQDADSPQLVDGNQTTASIPSTGEAENLVSNAYFEEDRNGDGIPDYWEAWQVISGSGSRLQILDGYKGGYCLKITANTTGSRVESGSTLIAVASNQKYYFSVKSYSQYANNGEVTIVLRWYNKNEVDLETPTFIEENANGQLAWNTFSEEVTSPATAKYVRICLDCETPTTAPAWVYYDDVIFSGQKIAIPTEGLVNEQFWSNYTTTTIGSDWTDVVTIPNTSLTQDCDYAFVSAFLETVSNTAWYYLRVIDTTVNKASNQFVLRATSTNMYAMLTFMLPWNVKNHTLKVQAKGTSGYTATIGGYSWWGFSPHAHR